MHLDQIRIKNHSILGDLDISFINPATQKPYSVIAFVGENGCGKTTLLNEIFDYKKSLSIVKDERSPEDFHGLFIHQNSLYVGAMNEVYKLITGKEGPYPSSSGDFNGGMNPFGLRGNVVVNNLNEGAEIIAKFGDEKVLEIYTKGDVKNLGCAGQVNASITGQQPKVDATTLSSGQSETLLKIKLLQGIKVGTDALLLDEPETSLHPRWQEIILDAIKDLVTGQGANAPQLFVATHSERVLESLVKNGDALIVRLYRQQGKVYKETIEEMDLCLPHPTYAELDYVVFKMPSYEYHDQLLMRYADIIGKTAISDLDKAIRLDSRCLKPDHRKTWSHIVKGKPNNYRTLPIYIRNWFHHASEGKNEPTKEELIRSIELLRLLVKNPIGK